CFKRLTSREFRGESSGDLRNARGGFFEWGSVRRPFGGEKIRSESEHARGRPGRLWLSREIEHV
ncbi:hypothetical protein H5410_046888, partial [Solanum commersonii]